MLPLLSILIEPYKNIKRYQSVTNRIELCVYKIRVCKLYFVNYSTTFTTLHFCIFSFILSCFYFIIFTLYILTELHNHYILQRFRSLGMKISYDIKYRQKIANFSRDQKNNNCYYTGRNLAVSEMWPRENCRFYSCMYQVVPANAVN